MKVFTRRIPLVLSSALLGAALGLPALAQEGQGGSRPPGKNDPAGQAEEQGKRTIHREGSDGLTSTLTAWKEGQQWRVELTRQRAVGEQGRSSEQRLALVFPSDAEKDQAMNELLEHPPQDPDRWIDQLEDVAGFQVDFDLQGPIWRDEQQTGGELDGWKDLPETARDDLQRALDAARREWRQAMRRLKDIPLPGRPLGQNDGPSTDKVYLRNGDVISGQILNMDPATIRVQAPGGEMALPRDQVQRIELERPAHPVLGVTVDEAEGGVKVSAVQPGSPAAQAGIAEGDLITRFGERDVRDARDLREQVWAHRVGQQVEVEIQREDRPQQLKVTLGGNEGPQ